jgi:hypothetical protein
MIIARRNTVKADRETQIENIASRLAARQGGPRGMGRRGMGRRMRVQTMPGHTGAIRIFI